MSRFLLTSLFLTGILMNTFTQQPADSVTEMLNEQNGRLDALNERVAVNESDLGKLNKIKVSGYIQAQFESYQTGLLKPNDAQNTFYIRRARVKFTYQATDGVKFVLQPDFSTGNLSLKDAYAVASIPKLPFVTLWAGQFNRPVYEVEYSSGQREVFERSRVIRTLYPGEREIGAKLEVAPVNIPVKFQLAVVNGNFTGKEAKDIDSHKDLMARVVYSLNLPSANAGIDIGAHTYYGSLQAKNPYISDYRGVLDSAAVNNGSYMDKRWFGGEMQIYLDVMGGLSLKGEYLSGRNAFSGESAGKPNRERKFSGYYAMLIKNIGQKNQFAARYDFFDPDRLRSGNASGSEIYYKTLTLAWQYYLNEFIRISLNFEIPKNEINTINPDEIKDNVFGIRLQAKF
jgi:phosphate-selective porin